MEWNRVRHVVVPVDLEDPVAGGLKLALQAASSTEGVHVLYALPEVEPSLMAQIDDEHRLANARKSLRAWLEKQGAPDGVRTHVRIGRADRLVAELAKTVEADLVVVPSHGRQGLQRALLGSVAERIIRFSPCPVLVLRRPER